MPPYLTFIPTTTTKKELAEVSSLKDYLFYEGDIRDILSSQNIDKDFFAPLSLEIVVKSIQVLTTVAIRSIHFRKEHIPEIKIRQG